MDEQTQKCETVCEIGEVFNIENSSCEPKCIDGEIKDGECSCPPNKKLLKGVCVNNPLSKKWKNYIP